MLLRVITSTVIYNVSSGVGQFPADSLPESLLHQKSLRHATGLINRSLSFLRPVHAAFSVIILCFILLNQHTRCAMVKPI